MSNSFQIRLRALEPEDWHSTWCWRKNPSLWDTVIYLPRVATPAQEQDWLHERVFSPGNTLVVGIEKADEDKLIGLVALVGRDFHHRHANLEVVIADEALHNQGYGTEAALLMLSHAFVVLGLERVEARVRADHAAGQAFLKKAGFTQEALLRRALRRDGLSLDVQVFSILAAEFAELRPLWQWPYPPA